MSQQQGFITVWVRISAKIATSSDLSDINNIVLATKNLLNLRQREPYGSVTISIV